MPTPRAEFLAGARATIPLVIGALPFGIIFGAAAITTGLSPLATIAMSIFVFAGSAEFIGVGLVKAGVSVPIIILTTFVVNLRHALYSATLAPYVKKLPQRWLLPLGYMLTDEAFVVASTHYADSTSDPTYKHWYFLGSELILFVCWQIFTWVGIFAGTHFQDATRLGLDFALSVTFIGMLIPLMKSRPVLASVIVASVVAVIANPLPNKIGLMIAALSGVAAGVIAEGRGKPEPETIAISEEIAP
ncbi:MAG TPA: AzlC family ABC transporter permease [Phototrophicaceae bacterium]|nr:AzlC family ABC transporter permease [Phototrophicaceae bacterium]